MATMAQAFLKAKKSKAIYPSDAKNFEEFIKEWAIRKKLSKRSIYKYWYVGAIFLSKLKEMGYSLRTLDRKGTLNLIEWLQNSNWAEETRESYWWRFCRMYKDISKRKNFKKNGAYELLVDRDDKYRYEVDQNNVEEKGTLTQEEILKLISIEHEYCYKVFFAILYLSGTRSGEALTLHIENVEETSEGAYVLHLRQSKTAKRNIDLIEKGYLNYLRTWLQIHPQKDKLDAPLFLNATGMPLKAAMANKRLKQLLRKAGIKKRKVTLHSFRHSRATHLAGTMTEATLCAFFGWSIGSDTPRRYIRKNQLDVKKALKIASGEKVEEVIKPAGVFCLNCHAQNPSSFEYCSHCNMPLDRKRYEDVIKNIDQEKLLRKLLEEKHEEILAAVLSGLKKKGITGNSVS